MRRLFQNIKERYDNKADSILVTITDSFGSTPRQKGAYMLVDEKGRVDGTVGGGSLEYRAVTIAMELLKEKKNALEHFDLGATDKDGLHMVCGGETELLFYYIGIEEADGKLIKEVLSAEENNRPYLLYLPKKQGKAKLCFPDYSDKEAENTMAGTQPSEKTEKENYFVDRFCCDGTVYIFGGGHLGQETAALLDHVGFRCIVIDDREEYVKSGLYPETVQTRCMDFTNLSKEFTIREQDYLIVVTRGHMCDIEVERFALRTEASYIGVVGSRRKTAYVRKVLMKEGFDREQLDRVVTPIGLDIGSETPAEIAVSIAAQLIQVRKKRNGK